MKTIRLAAALAPVLALGVPLAAQEVGQLEKQISDFRLPNGFHFTVVERHGSPVVAFNTTVLAGSVNDPAGENGMARLMERMAFKGTDTIGSKNWAAEKQALQEIETFYDQFDTARSHPTTNSFEVDELDAKLKLVIEQAEALGQPEEWRAAIAENGGINLGSSTSQTRTEYHYSLPSNRAEAWFYLESQHFLHPVFREFYKEREALLAENRAHYGNVQTRLFDDFLAAAFEVHPYRNPVGGWTSTIPQLRLRDAKAFYEKYYGPSNVEFGIAGDITAAEAQRLAEKYFAPIPPRPAPAAMQTADPLQAGPKNIMFSVPLPLMLIGYKRPFEYDKDDVAFDVLALALAHERAGYLYRDLVTEKHMALTVEAAPTFPDGRYTNLFVFMLQPGPNHTPDELLNELESEIRVYTRSNADTPDLMRAKAMARVMILEKLETNEGLASILPVYAAEYGSWKRLFIAIDQLNKVTGEDLRRVASRYLIAQGRTVASTMRLTQ